MGSCLKTNCEAVEPSRLRRMIGDRDMDDPSTVVCKDHEDKEQPKRALRVGPSRPMRLDSDTERHELARELGRPSPRAAAVNFFTHDRRRDVVKR